MSDTTIVNLSGYRFVQLANPEYLQPTLKAALTATGVKGAVLLAKEGVNVNLAGTRAQTDAAVACIDSIPAFTDLWLKESSSDFVPHKKLRVRVRKEIIAFDGEGGVEQRPQAPTVSPQTFQQWIEDNKEFTLLDTRNDYEVESGTFECAVHLNIKHFKHFKQAVLRALEEGKLDKGKPMVTFCTGGIRCEKAAPWLLSEGFKEVHQIEGGVINYLQQTNASHWKGDCFVFDERVELTPALQPTGAGLCEYCQLAVPAGSDCQCQLGPHYHASYIKP